MPLRRRKSRREIVLDNSSSLKMSFFEKIRHKLILWIKELKGEL